MKNFIYTLSSMILLALITSCSGSDNQSNSGNNSGNKTLDNTEDKKVNQTNVYTAPKELSYVKVKEGFSYDKFYPIGWSDDGKFAYAVEPADENSGLYFFEIHIYDIVNNKELWSWKPEELETGSVQSVWNENTELLSQRLNEYRIVQTKQFTLESSKISYKGNDYEIIMDSKLETDDDFGIDVMKGIKLTMKSPQLGNKNFFEQQIDSKDYIISAYIPGLLVSPKDDRIVVICQKERIGAGGPPNMVFFEIIGSNLSTGFVKEAVN